MTLGPPRLGDDAWSMAARLLLADPQASYTKAQRDLLAVLARGLGPGVTLRARHESGGFDSRLLVQLTLDVAQGLEFESIERDAQGAHLLVRELFRGRSPQRWESRSPKASRWYPLVSGSGRSAAERH